MASSSSVFNLTRFTALASGDVIPVVDVSDTTQSAHGSLDSITVANFFGAIPVVVAIATNTTPQLTVKGATSTVPSVATSHTIYAQAADESNTSIAGNAFSATGSATAVFQANVARGTSALPTATSTSDALGQFNAAGFDGTNYINGVKLVAQATEAWTLTNRGAKLTIQTTLTGNANVSSRITIDGAGLITTSHGLTIAGALAGVTSATFSTNLISTTALATPSALSATQFTAFASTASGAAIMGFGTTNDVALMNRAGTVCLGVGPNTTTINIPGALTQTGLATFNGGATIASGQTLTVTGATITGLTAASVGAGTYPAGAHVFAGAVSGITTLDITGDARLASAGGNVTLNIGSSAPAADNSGRMIFQNSNAVHNWQIDNNRIIGDALSFTPSTANGGATFTTPVFTLLATGVAKITGGLDLTGNPPTAAASHTAIGGATQTTIGANGAASVLTANPLGYLKINVAGTSAIIPYYNA